MPAALVAAGALFAASLEAADAASLRVSVRNELPAARASETIEISASAIAPLSKDLTRVHVFEEGSGREVVAQTLDLDGDGNAESLIFQADVPASGERSFILRTGEKRTYRRDDFKVYGRFVRERFDDFAWENDRVAHRMYGAALETWQKEPLTSSGVDVWLKRTRRLVINDWYMTDDYHHDSGEGGDFYSVGRSRGCGGSGLWRDERLLVSKNFRQSAVLANGPIRLVFELTYPAWDAAGVRSETKRITLDAGQNFNRFESRYDVDGAAGVAYAVGIKNDPAGKLRIERASGWMRSWAPVKGASGQFGCAVIMQPAAIADVKAADGNDLIITRPGVAPVIYWAGTGWDRSGDFKDAADFDRHVEEWVQRINAPLHVEVKAK